MVGLAKAHLASSIGVAPEEVGVTTVETVTWPDAGLGCPKPGVDYLRMPRPGFRIWLEAKGTAYEYHTDADHRVIRCGSRAQ
jgi:hypothetical protein